MEKNDIFNTNLLQLPLKAQVADEGVVQDIAPVAEPTAPAMGEGLVLDMLAQDGGVLRRLSNVTPKKCEKLASGFLHRGEITLLCGDGGVGKGQFVAQIAKSLTTGEATEFFPQAPEGTGNIVILAGEDPIDMVLCPRMDAAGADLNKVAVIAPDTYYEEMHKMPQLGDPDLMNWIAAGDPLLLVIDPFQAFLPDFCKSKQSSADPEFASAVADAGAAARVCNPAGDPYQQKSRCVWAQTPQWLRRALGYCPQCADHGTCKERQQDLRLSREEQL